MSTRALGAEGVQTANIESRDARKRRRDGRNDTATESDSRDNESQATRSTGACGGKRYIDAVRSPARKKGRGQGGQDTQRLDGGADREAKEKTPDRRTSKRARETSERGSPGKDRAKRAARTATAQPRPVPLHKQLRGKVVKYSVPCKNAEGKVMYTQRRRGRVISRSRQSNTWLNVDLEETDDEPAARTVLAFHIQDEGKVWELEVKREAGSICADGGLAPAHLPGSQEGRGPCLFTPSACGGSRGAVRAVDPAPRRHADGGARSTGRLQPPRMPGWVADCADGTVKLVSTAAKEAAAAKEAGKEGAAKEEAARKEAEEQEVAKTETARAAAAETQQRAARARLGNQRRQR